MPDTGERGAAAGGDLEKSTVATGDRNLIGDRRVEGNQSVYVGLANQGWSDDGEGSMIVAAIRDIRDNLTRVTELLAALNTEVKLIQQGFRMDLKLTESEITELTKEINRVRQDIDQLAVLVAALDRHRQRWIRIVSFSLISLFIFVGILAYVWAGGQ